MTTTKEALRQIAATTDNALLPLWATEDELLSAIRETRKVATDVARYGAAAVERAEKRIASLEIKLEVVRAELAPLAAIAKAGSWTRFVLVPGGHVHRPTCSTLYFTTQRYVLPDYSGADEAELVEAAGEAACTVCFPSAPVDRPSTIPALVKAREEREAEAAAKVEKKVAAQAAAISWGKETFKTLRAAENAIGWEIESVVSRRYMDARDAEHREYLDGLAAADLATARSIVEAIQAKYPEYDGEAILAKKFEAKAKAYRKGGWSIPADATL
ncbi:hypothetical protein SEA_TFORTROY_49 [Arthrobacter phage TforTroy]|uniref:Uncharacterized protein n=1 Tax=Arthrobacter phage TforTroy TaxID=3118973 RepID=A0ABZ2CNH6_9CAUD